MIYQGYGIRFMEDRARPSGWLLRARIHWRTADGDEACCDIHALVPVAVHTKEEAQARSIKMGMLAIDQAGPR